MPTASDYNYTAFGLQRVAEPYLLADLINKYGVDTNYWGTQVTGTGVVAAVPLMSAVSVKAGAGVGTALMRTHEYWRYQAGKGPRWLMTGMSTDYGNEKNIRAWGQFDANDGIFFQHSRPHRGNYLDIVIRSSSGYGSKTIAQRDWNVHNHPELNPTTNNIYECTYQYLGAGSVWFWINGMLVHEEKHAGLLPAPYMRTAQLPLSVQITDTGGAPSLAGWISVCSTINVEGGSAPAEWGYSYSRPGAPFALATTETPLISLRPLSTINSIENRTLLLPKFVSISASNFGGAAQNATFKVYLNSTLSGATDWQPRGQGSNAERDIGTLAAGFAAGTQIATKVLEAGGTFDISLSQFNVHGRKLMRRDLATVTLDLITVTCQLNAGTGSGSCTIDWTET